MSLVDASRRTQVLPDRLAVVCFVPDPGHLIPLLKIAAQVRRNCDILVVVPDELVDLANDYGFRAVGVGPVRPENADPEIQRYIAASEWVRIASALAPFHDKYILPLKIGVEHSLPRHLEVLEHYAPTCILADGHGLVVKQARGPLQSLKVPVFFHLPSAFIGRHHNTWSLKHCYWTDYRTAMRDAVRKTRNEFRLLAKRWSAKRMRFDRPTEVDRLSPLLARKRGFTYLASGTSFLEAGLLSEHLLYTGADHLVLPTVPPVQLPLPQALQDWLDQSSDEGVVYVSFGTLVRPDVATVTRIVRAALSHGKRVLLQYRGQFPAVPAVRQEQWVPQATVLSHPAICLVITHGGAGTLEEALWYGRPSLCIPRVWDHYYTSWIVRLLGAGVVLPPRSLRSQRRLSAGVRRALMPEYADGARSVAGVMRKHWSDNKSAVTGLFSVGSKASQKR